MRSIHARAALVGLLSCVNAALAAPEFNALIRDLNHPQRAKRASAAEALTNLGSEIIPKLESAKDGKPFEVQAAIEQILNDLRWSEHAVLITNVVFGGSAAKKGVIPGDAFLAVDGRPTH